MREAAAQRAIDAAAPDDPALPNPLAAVRPRPRPVTEEPVVAVLRAVQGPVAPIPEPEAQPPDQVSPLAEIRPRARPKVDIPAAHLKRAMAYLRGGEIAAARAAAERAGPVAEDIINWHRFRAGVGRFDEVRDFIARNPDWPGLSYLKRRSEGVLPTRSRQDDVIAFFDGAQPQTGQGTLALVGALRRSGDPEAAEAEAIRAWQSRTMNAATERVLLRDYRDALKPHHITRLDMLLWSNQAKAAARMYGLVPKSQKALAEARLALRGQKNGVDGLVKAVPEALQSDPGLLFERFQWRARKGRSEAALELLLAREGSAESLGRPNMWAGWRRSLARSLMREGEAKEAYNVASAHGLEAGRHYADLEWLSGYLALSYLDDAEAALGHFKRFGAAVKTPISLGRAGYWEGRAWDALGQFENAQAAYQEGARWQTSFYGLLAADAAEVPRDPALAGRMIYPNWRELGLGSNSVLAAARLLLNAGERDLAERFMAHLIEGQSAEFAGAVGDLALALGEPHIAVMVGKRAAGEGVVIPRAYFPLVDLVASAENVDPAMALAIARRESEFDPGVQSGAGARGLMQLMPATAREVAGSLDLDYSAARLIDDPSYNATLGTTYLAWMADEFNANPIYMAGAYNAGPGRIRRWVRQRGDPTTKDVEAMVDWIEHIPFRETRNYVMRVAESLPIYQARLSGETGSTPFGVLILHRSSGPN
ncbi:MAG: transglycosylase SLT domain-containing protein [Pseudomonadota bacterium]